jgi:transcriptional regulator with XRE-family HTH domain
MLQLHSFIKALRQKIGLSQRLFATSASISFRQLQRIEKGESDITLTKFLSMLDTFGLKLTIEPEQPNWMTLAYFGMPITCHDHTEVNYSEKELVRNITICAPYLAIKNTDISLQRARDAFKALLLALMTHYPTKFKKIVRKSKLDLIKLFNLHQISGRDIKLRNICVARLAAVI